MFNGNMYKKVILNGGYPDKAPDGGLAFCKEITEGFHRPVRILECLFGRENNTWDLALKKDVELFRKVLTGVQVEFRIANKVTLVDQIGWADVVYFRGGDTQRLYDILSAIPQWQDALEDKVVVGSSAGAYILSEVYVHAAEKPETRKGFGLVQVKTVAHYRSTFFHNGDCDEARQYWDKVDELLENSDPHLEMMKLREGEFRVL